MMCQVDNRLLVGGGQILDNQLVEVGEGEFYCDVKFAGITLFTIGRYAMEGQ